MILPFISPAIWFFLYSMTTAMMRQFGVEISVSGDQTWRIPGNAAYQSQDYQIEPDVSAAAYFYGMAVLSGGNVLVRHVHFDSLPGRCGTASHLRENGLQC